MQLLQRPVNQRRPVVGIAEYRSRRPGKRHQLPDTLLYGRIRDKRGNNQLRIGVKPETAQKLCIFLQLEFASYQSVSHRINGTDSGMPATAKITQSFTPGIPGVLRNRRPAGNPVIPGVAVEKNHGNGQLLQRQKYLFRPMKICRFPQDAGYPAADNHFRQFLPG